MASAELISRESNIARIKATVSADEVNKHFKRVYREFAKNLDLPGFRKGKVPENVIRQRVGADSVVSAVSDELKRFVIGRALEDLDLSPRQGNTRWHSDPTPQPDQAGEFEFSLPVLPIVTLPDYRTFELTVPVLAVTEEMKQTYRERLEQRFTQFPVKDAAASQGNAVRMSFSSTLRDSGEATPLAADDMIYVLGQEGNFPGWDEQLSSSEAGAQVSFDFTVPTDFADPRVAGKDVRVTVDVKSIHEVKPPLIDDHFVKEHLNLDSLDQLDSYIEATLTRERDQQVLQMKSDMALQRVVDQLEAAISEDMVDDELDGLIKEYDRSLREQGSSLDAWLQEKDMSLQAYRDEMRPSAILKIKRFLVIKAVADTEQMTATADDFRRFALYLIQREGVPPERIKELMDQPDFVREAAYQILRDKVLKHLADNVKFSETDAASAVGGQESGLVDSGELGESGETGE